VNTILIR